MTFLAFDRPRVGDQIWVNHAEGFVRVALIDEEKQSVILVGGNYGGQWTWPIRDLIHIVHPVVRRDGQEGAYQCN